MTQTALIVAHGQPSEPEVGEIEITRLAARIAQHLPGADIRGVTLATPDALETLAQEVPDGTLVYPMFMADGWFTTKVLPRRLGDAPVRLMPPFGTDPGLTEFGAEVVARRLAMMGWHPQETDLIIVGHGSGRSNRPAEVTAAFAHQVQAKVGCAALSLGFVEEGPYLAQALADHSWRAICLPFFAARRGHVLEDLPEAVAEVGYRGVVLDPIGLDPATPAFIAQSLIRAWESET